VKYLVERFGIERVRSMLRLWGEAQPSAQVVQRALGLPLAELDRDFRAHVSQRLARFVAEFQVDFAPYRDLAEVRARAKQTPGDADAQAGLAIAEVMASNFEAAAGAAQAALRISPRHRLANFALARVALERGDAAEAELCLRAILASGADGYSLRMLLVHAALARSQPAAAAAELEAAIKLDPERPEAWPNMLELAGKLKDEALALRAVTALAQLDQHDRAIHAAYVALLAKREAWPDVVRAGESAMYVDPANPALHWHLGRAYASTGRPADALSELDRALALGHPAIGGIQLTRARVLLALGKRTQARAAAQAAVDAEPELRKESERVLRGL
jgi:predicted Zn-dependent protease